MNPIHFIHIAKNAGSSIRALVKEREDTGESLQIILHGHERTCGNVNGPSFVVLRDPIDRFSSAFFFLLQNRLEFQNPERTFPNPNCFAEALADGDRTAWNCMERHGNPSGAEPIYRFVMIPQYCWVDCGNPDYILLFDNLASDWERFLRQTERPHAPLPQENASERMTFEYSGKALAFLRAFYARDFRLLKWVQKSRESRPLAKIS